MQGPQINVSKIAVGGGIMGLVFAIGSMAIFFVGIPILRFLFPAALVVGSVIALILHFRRHKTPGAPWLISATEKTADASLKGERTENPGPLRAALAR